MAQMNSKESGPEQHLNSNISHSALFFVLLCSYSKYLFTDYEKKHMTSQDPQQVLTASMGSSNNHGILSLCYYGPFSNVGMWSSDLLEYLGGLQDINKPAGASTHQLSNIISC